MTESSSKWRVSKLQDSDVPAVRELFKQVFAVELSLQHWDWKYANGGGVGMVVRDDQNQIAAYYGGVERRILDRGEPALTLQCCDTMVATTQRGTLSKKGPYFLAATTFLDTYIGYNRPYLFGFGFPNKRVMRLGEHLGVQADIGGVVQIEWEPASQDKLAGESFNADDPEHSRLLEGLWQAMSAEMGHKILTVRDQAYIQYRYLDNPTREKVMTMEAIYPDGRKETINQVNKYNHNWQIAYQYTEDSKPILPAGTILQFTSVFDNTANNPINPDPDQWVVFGRRGVDEMSHAWVGITHINEEQYVQAIAERRARQETLRFSQ